MKTKILQGFKKAQEEKRKLLSILIDPDRISKKALSETIKLGQSESLDYFLIGGSLMHSDRFEMIISTIKENCTIPVLIFPGSSNQINPQADGILFLSLISGRNPEYLIGTQVVATPKIEAYDLDTLATGYMLIESGSNTTALYISNSKPIPYNKPEIAATTALAGQYLGLQSIYLDAGSGAKRYVPYNMIETVRKKIDIPLIVGGGIDSPEKAYYAYESGADMVVVGTGVEKNPTLLPEMTRIRDSFQKQTMKANAK